MIAGTQRQIEDVEKFILSIEEIATPEAGGEIKDYTIKLVHIDSDQAAELLNNFFKQHFAAMKSAGAKGIKDSETTVTVVPDTLSNQLFVNATEKNFNKITEILASIDTEEAGSMEVRITEVFQLKYADPNNASNAINRAFQKKGNVPEKERVDAVVDWGTQSIVVTASEKNMTRVRGIVEQLDVGTGQQQVREMYVLSQARATDVANIANQILRETRVRNRKNQLPVSVVANENTNSLIISGPQGEVDSIKNLIVQLDVEPVQEAGRYVKVYQIRYARLDSIANAINQAFNRYRGISPEDRVDVAYDWDTGTLIAIANKDRHAEIETMLADVDKESGSTREFHTIELVNADVNDVAQALQQTINQQRSQRGSPSRHCRSIPRRIP